MIDKIKNIIKNCNVYKLYYISQFHINKINVSLTPYKTGIEKM